MKKIALSSLFFLALLPRLVLAQTVCSATSTSCGGSGASPTGNNNFTGVNTFLDGTNFSIKNTADPTKIGQFSVAGIASGNTRTFTLPAITTTLCGAGSDCLFSVTQTFSAAFTIPGNVNAAFGPASTAGTLLRWSLEQTPDSFIIGTSTTSNTIIIAEAADNTFDFAHAAATDPTLIGHSHNQNTTQWWSLTHNATDVVFGAGTGQLQLSGPTGIDLNRNGAGFVVNGSGGAGVVFNNGGQERLISGTGSTLGGVVFATGAALGNTNTSGDDRGYIKGAAKTLVESSATSVVRIAIPALAATGGRFCYTVQANDATDIQSRSSCFHYTLNNKAATETCLLHREDGTTVTAETNDGSGAGAISAGTLTYGITCDTTPANAVDLSFNAVSSLTQTTLQIFWTLWKDGSTGAITPQ